MQYEKQSNRNKDDKWSPSQVKEQGPDEYNQSIEKAMEDHLTCREQEFPHLYRWRDELRSARHFLIFASHGYIISL